MALAVRTEDNEATLRITKLAIRMLRPIVRLLLRHGVSCTEFAELGRWLYVESAMRHDEFWIKSRPFKSRVACITGLSRKAVDYYSKITSPAELMAETSGNRAGKVQEGWLADPEYLDSYGQPLVLPLRKNKTGVSFESLCHRYGRDVPYRTILDEMKHAGAVEIQDDVIRLVTVSYVPKELDQLMDIAATHTEDLFSTINYNMRESGFPRLQREWFSRLVPEEKVSDLQQHLSARLKKSCEDIYRELLENVESTPQPDRKYCRVGIGAYWFENNAN